MPLKKKNQTIRLESKSLIKLKNRTYYNILRAIFGLLSSSLLLLVITQRFDRCVFRSSAGVPCLSWHGKSFSKFEC